ncbi:MAG TPA: BglII/BstYI family type II restriction endonuclease [Fimbriimonadaceae bacterium]|jgi:hypothetical protein|nr:hypothetical protein [Paracoccaceae bacterium]HRJ97966.1 BglII/BstYI family type II restriction endonuclease [Fimbriimonadaceae bacterium]
MRVVEVYSHLNGLESLQVHKPRLWSEIEHVIAGGDSHALTKKISREVRMPGRELFSPRAMNHAVGCAFRAKGWAESRTSYWVTRDARLIRRTINLPDREQRAAIEAEGQEAIKSFNQTDFVKERVAVEVQFGKYAFVAFDLFVKHMAFFVGDVIDVGIEILPMKELQAQMSSGIGYYEGELYNLIRQGRGVPAVPLVLLGVAP